MTKTVALLPCPFCGSEAGEQEQQGGYIVACFNTKKCSFSPSHWTRSKAKHRRNIIAWNTRASTRVEQPELVEPSSGCVWNDLHLPCLEQGCEVCRTQTDQQLREEVERLVREAYEEGVEDGIDYQQSRRPDRGEPQPQWIDSVARVELIRLIAHSSLSSSSLTNG